MKSEHNCMNCGALNTLLHPDGTTQCLECGHVTETPPATWQRQSSAPAITVSRYHKADGFPTRNFAIHFDGALLAVTVYRKGAEAVRAKLMEMLAGPAVAPSLAETTK